MEKQNFSIFSLLEWKHFSEYIYIIIIIVWSSDVLKLSLLTVLLLLYILVRTKDYLEDFKDRVKKKEAKQRSGT